MKGKYENERRNMLTDEQKEKVRDWLDKNTIFKDRMDGSARRMKSMDIHKPILKKELIEESREVVGDIGTAMATYPMWAATAPIMADSTTLWAGILWWIEWGLDTVLTHYCKK